MDKVIQICLIHLRQPNQYVDFLALYDVPAFILLSIAFGEYSDNIYWHVW